PGLLRFGRLLAEHLSADPMVADTLEWLIRRFVLNPHESLAYSKLPNFTFRFRSEMGRLRFYDLGVWRFGLTDSRHASMSAISRDVGLWETVAGTARLTDEGRRFVAEVLR